MAASSHSGQRPAAAASLYTWIGIAIALFGLIIVRQAVFYFYPNFTACAALWRESLDWLCVLALLFIIRRGERLRLDSVGLGRARWWKSIVWGVVLTVALIIAGTVADVIAILSHYHLNEFAQQFTRLPVWLLALTCVRGGVAEELFYRGYAIERLNAVGLSRFSAAAIPVLIFSLGHWNTGWPNVVNAFLLGLVLSLFYIWRRDLVLNMIGHCLVDFISVVGPRLFT
jgi:membrane protease YdiL (CAAX protease family)